VLSEALKDKAPEIRKRAVEALKDAGTITAIPIIQKAFGDKNAGVRLHAALMLRKIGNRRGVPVLGQVVLADTEPAVRSAAARYLGSVGVKDPRAVAFLAQVIDGDKSAAVRIRAVESLGFIQLPQAIAVLRQALSDKDPGVRIRATEVMGRVLAKDFE
jgi:HEAT repeat protein